MKPEIVIGAFVVIAIIAGGLVYQANANAQANLAYGRTLGGSIANTIGGVGNIVGAVVGMAGA